MHLLAGLPLLALFSTNDASFADTPPAPLLCLQRYYGVQPILKMGQWFALLDHDQLLPYHGGREKTFTQTLTDPDLQDMFPTAGVPRLRFILKTMIPAECASTRCSSSPTEAIALPCAGWNSSAREYWSTHALWAL